MRLTYIVLLVLIYNCNSDLNESKNEINHRLNQYTVPVDAISIEDGGFDAYYADEGNLPSVRGRVLNLSELETSITEVTYSIVTPFHPDLFQVTKVKKLEADGSFSLDIDYPFPYQQIWLNVGNLYRGAIYATSELFIELDADILRYNNGNYKGPGIDYQLEDGELNELMNVYTLWQTSSTNPYLRDLNTKSSEKRMGKIEPEVYIAYLDSIYNILYQLDDTFINEHPSDHNWLIKNNRLSDYYSKLLVEYWSDPRLSMDDKLFSEINNHKAYAVSNDGADFYNQLFNYLKTRVGQAKQNMLDFKDHFSFEPLMEAKLEEYLGQERLAHEMLPYDTLRVGRLQNEFNQVLSDSMIVYNAIKTTEYLDSNFLSSKSDYFKLKMSYGDPKNMVLSLLPTLKTVSTKWTKDILEGNYTYAAGRLAEINKDLSKATDFSSNNEIGTPVMKLPSGAKLYEVSDMTDEELIGKLKKAFLNKAILIDFWATWCGPCIKEMPVIKRYQEEFSEEPVEFVYLCTSQGSVYEKWKSLIAEHKLGGTHLYVDESIARDLMKELSLQGFPSYAFFDRSGTYKEGAIRGLSYMSMDDFRALVE